MTLFLPPNPGMLEGNRLEGTQSAGKPTMCGYCGCASGDKGNHSLIDFQGQLHDHGHGAHSHGPGDDERRVLELSRAVLGKNDRLAERARGIFLAKGIGVLNLVSSPGSGKTTLLEKTIDRLKGIARSAIIVGDCATDNDARRLKKTGVPAVQVTTGNVCHLDAHMVLHALEHFSLSEIDLLLIENVGNLVCPSAFDLGEDHRVVLTSVTEGEDKPEKYPTIFHDAAAVVLTKIDLSQAVEFDRGRALTNIRNVAPGALVFEISAKSGEGMEAWISYLEGCVSAKKAVAI